jgi:sugar/nucleoside kinase (ribokinase family)
MACKTLARLCHGEPFEDGNMQAAPPVVSAVIPLCMIGDDDSGNKLLKLLEECGSACSNVETRVVRSARADVKGLRTALSVLPIYQDGRRGCFFDAASNTTFSAEQMIKMFADVFSGGSSDSQGNIPPVYGAMLFGYPHLLPLMQGNALAVVFNEARHVMVDGGIIALDLNGVPDIQFSTSGGLRSPQDLKRDAVIGPALEHVDLLHMNEDELALLTGCRILDTPGLEQEDQYAISKAVELFLRCGVAVVAVTRGKKGSYVACNNADRMHKSPSL